VQTVSVKKILPLFRDSKGLAGVVVDLPDSLSPAEIRNVIANIHHACGTAEKQFLLHLSDHEQPEILNIVKSSPADIGLIVPFERLRNRQADFAPHDITVELSLAPYATRSALLPDVGISELPGRLVEAALTGATDFVVPVNVAGHYLPDTLNSPALAALHRLADNPLQSTDAIWNELSAARYGPAADKAAASLKRTSVINDLIFRILNVQALCDQGWLLSIEAADARIKQLLVASPPAPRQAVLQQILEPTGKTVSRTSQEKETAIWLLDQSIRDANDARRTNPTPQTQALYDAMLSLRSATLLCHDATQAYLLTKIYAIDGAPSTRESVEAALKNLRNLQKHAFAFDGTDGFVASVRKSLAKSQKGALLVRSLAEVKTLSRSGRHDAAAEALLALLNSEKYAPHISKQNVAVGQIASSLKAFGEQTSNITVMRHGDGSWAIEKIAGRWAWVIGPGKPCLYLDFLPGRLDTPADYLLSFDYFDKGNWTITFHYDSAYPPDQKSDYHPAEPLQLTNTNTWKQGTFELTNCLFASRQNALADMRFVTGSGAFIRNIRLTPKPTGSFDRQKGKRLFYRILGSQSNGPFVRKTRTVAAPDYSARIATTGMANAGFTEYPFCFGNWSFTFRQRYGLFPKFATSVPMDPTRVNTADILVDWVYEPDGCVWGPACRRFSQTFVATGPELVAVTTLVASPRGTFEISVHQDGPKGRLILQRHFQFLHRKNCDNARKTMVRGS